MIHLIVACGQNGVIGKNGTMPWHIPADLQHFKALTIGHTIIMGRCTYESIGHALPDRQNIIVSSTLKHVEGAAIVASLAEALTLAECQEIFIIGGAMLYQAALPLAEQLDITLVEAEPEGDTWFPEVDWCQYAEIEREMHTGTPGYQYITYKKR